MKGLKGARLALVGVAVAVLALAGGLLLSGQVSAQDEAVSIGSATAAPGEEASVDLEALDIGAPGLGAWTIDIAYDPEVVTAVDCEAQSGSVCNPAFDDDTVRVTGAVATGHEGDTTLASITFECGESEGSSDLEITLQTFADATIGDPQDISDATAIEDGSITCEAPEAPTEEVVAVVEAGTGGGSDGALISLIGVLAAVGLAAIAGFGVLRLRTGRP